MTGSEAVKALPPIPADIAAALDAWHNDGAEHGAEKVAAWVDANLPAGYDNFETDGDRDEFWTNFWHLFGLEG